MFRPNPKPEKTPKKVKKPLKRTALKKVYKNKGEMNCFQEVLDEIPDTDVTRCFVCGKQINILTHSNFAHILAKGRYPRFRTYAANIKILCFNIDGTGCHSILDHQPRSVIQNDPKWQPLLELAEQLKQEYKQGKFLNDTF